MSSSKQREKNSPFFPLIAYFFFLSLGSSYLQAIVSYLSMSVWECKEWIGVFFFLKLLLFNNSHSIVARCSTYDVISDQPELIVRK